ncbi:nickel transporter permease [Pseudonocardia kunmingensis]|uniref:Peptide/nickel transport system permease protein n=1 Tax=Pseudonocardia kunmingensis TaxID=630975 RepID=A0A543DP45_9PSEU|nr:nickel transporter permease [Pseudonocardia kunmingensis]TQM11110.1 peptide/nickel transport system permease protein [Pseudonocardia kunmingensis]
MTIPQMRTDPAGAASAEPLPTLVGSGWAVGRAMVRDRTAVLGLVLIVSLVGAAALAGVLAPHDPDAVDVARKFAPPSATYPLGTDNLGRDLLSRLLFGARLLIGTAVAAGLSTALIGLVVGMVTAFYGGLLDTVLSRVVDIVLAFPLFLLALAITGVLGPGLGNLMVAVVAVAWASYARVVRSAVLAEREKPYVEAARAAGASDLGLLTRHLLPNIVAPIVVLTTLDIGVMLLAISGLSFLGLGVEPPAAEWGAMLSEGRNYLDRAPYLMLYPGLAIFLLVLGFNLLGDGLRDALDPRARRR